FVLQVDFHPEPGYLLRNAKVVWRFSTASTDPDSAPSTPSAEPRILERAPKKSYGGITKEKKRRVWGVSFPLGVTASGAVGAPLAATAAPGVFSSSEREVEHAVAITGTVRGQKRSYVVWTLEGNADSDTSLPAEVSLACVVRHQGPVRC